MNKFTYRVFLRTDRVLKNGEYPIFILLIYKRKITKVSLNITTHLHTWDSKNCIVRKADDEAEKKNTLIAFYRNRVAAYETECIVRGYKISIEAAKEALTGSYSRHSFIDFLNKEWDSISANLAPTSIKRYLSHMNVLKEFRADPTFEEIDCSFLRAFESYLINIRKNNKNTVSKMLRWMKAIFNKAKHLEVIDYTPFDKYKISNEQGHREYLSMKEVHKIERLYARESVLPNLREVLRAFLFCCYTGLRLSDMRALKHKDIGDDVITIVMHKTKELVYIPLIPQAKDYLLCKGEPDDFVFNTVVDQMINRYLKRELPLIGIHKKITFHCARHTFATNCLEKGISKDTIQKVLGHKDIKTTDIYTKYTISHQKKEMSKWKR